MAYIQRIQHGTGITIPLPSTSIAKENEAVCSMISMPMFHCRCSDYIILFTFVMLDGWRNLLFLLVVVLRDDLTVEH